MLLLPGERAALSETNGRFPPRYKSLRIVALFPNKVKEVADYLTANALNVDSVADVNLDAIHVPGTPTMILVNGRGEVQNFWLGKLAEPESAAFLRELKFEEMETPQ